MGFVYPDAGWDAPEGLQYGTRDAYDTALAIAGADWVSRHAPHDGKTGIVDGVYLHTYAAMLAFGEDLDAVHWSDDSRPVARVYRCTLDQVVALLRAIYPEHADDPRLKERVRSATRWLYGVRKRDDGTGHRRHVETGEGVFQRIAVGHGGGRGQAGAPSAYILRLPADVNARGSFEARPEALEPSAPSVTVRPSARPSAVLGEPCLDKIIERHARARTGRGKPALQYRRNALAKLCDALLADGWTWPDIDRAHKAYIQHWKITDKTDDGRWLKRLDDFLRSTTRDHKTPDLSHGIVAYLGPGEPWPELCGVMLSGDMLAGWTWQLDVDGEVIQGVVEDSVGLGTEDAVRGRFAHWFYTDPAARRYWNSVWAAAERIAQSRIVTAALPDGIKVRQRDGKWQWAFAADFGTAFQRWQDIKVPDDATEQEAVAALLEWFASEQGQKELAAGQQRAIQAAAERAKRKQGRQAESTNGAATERAMDRHAASAMPVEDVPFDVPASTPPGPKAYAAPTPRPLDAQGQAAEAADDIEAYIDRLIASGATISGAVLAVCRRRMGRIPDRLLEAYSRVDTTAVGQ